MPQRHGGEVSAGYVDGKQAPAAGSYGGGPSRARQPARARRRACGTAPTARRRSPCSSLPCTSTGAGARAGAHRRRAPRSVACSRGDMNLRDTPSTLTCALAVLDVHADARSRAVTPKMRDAARVRNVEVEVLRPRRSGRPRRPRTITTCCGGDAEARRRAGCAASRVRRCSARAGRGRPKRCGARVLRVRQQRSRARRSSSLRTSSHVQTSTPGAGAASADGRAGTRSRSWGQRGRALATDARPTTRTAFLTCWASCSAACRAGLGACSTASATSPISSCIGSCAGAARCPPPTSPTRFPRRATRSGSEILQQSYRNLGRFLAEALWGWNASAEALASRVRIVNPELITRFTANGQSVVLLAAHFCNWEWLLLTAGVVLKVPIDAVYKPQRVTGIDEFLRARRSRFGGNPDSAPELHVRGDEAAQGRARVRAGRRPHAEARRGEALDALPQPGHGVLRRRRQDREDPEGAGHLRRDAPRRRPAATASSSRCSPSRRTTATPGPEIVERYARMLEQEIRRSPADWLWLHRKWKYGKPLYA